MNTKLIAIALVSTCAVFGAHAFQGEQNPLPPQPFQSTKSRAAVQAEARTPLKITNGGTGVQTANGSGDRATIRAEARAIVRDGVATYGEM